MKKIKEEMVDKQHLKKNYDSSKLKKDMSPQIKNAF
jgi:hypothetical protein